MRPLSYGKGRFSCDFFGEIAIAYGEL